MGQHEVEQNQRCSPTPQVVEGFLTVDRTDCVVTLSLEEQQHRRARLGMVLDDQDGIPLFPYHSILARSVAPAQSPGSGGS